MRKAVLATSFVCALGGAEIPVIGNTKAMEESFRRIAIKKAEEGKIDENTQTLVENLLANIQETLEPDLVSDIAVQQAMYDAAWMQIHYCGTVLDKDMDGVRYTLGAWRDTKHQNLRDCKGSEGIRFDTEETKCGALEADVLNLHVCNPENPPEWSEDSWEVYQWMQCLKDHVHPAYGSFTEQRQGCAAAEDDHAAWEQWCRDQQVSFEESYCMLEGAVAYNCHEYDTCRADAQHAFQLMTEATQTLEARVQTQQVGLNNLICLGREILAESVNVDNCNEETTHCQQCEEGGTLTINYKQVGEKVDCLANEAHPAVACDEAFHQEFYAEIESESAPMNPCTAVCSEGVVAYDPSYYIHRQWNAPAAAPAAAPVAAPAAGW